MTTFLRLLGDKNKQGALANAVQPGGSNYFEVDPISFRQIPGAPFAYWATEYIRNIFKKFPPYESESRLVRQGLSTADDFRFVRCWWEVPQEMPILETLRAGSDSYERTKWIPLLKGGGRSSFVSEINLVVNYGNDGRELKSWISGYVNSGWSKYIISTELYFQRGFSWALRSARFAPSAVPEGCIFSASRYEAFANKNDLPWIIGLLNSNVASFLLRMCSENFERPKYVVGIVSNLPLPNPEQQRKKELADLFYKATSIRRRNLRTCETSHCFLLPEYLLRGPESADDVVALGEILMQIDEIANDAYGLTAADIEAVNEMNAASVEVEKSVGASDAEEEDEKVLDVLVPIDALISWAAGVAFGRFDWRLATNERQVPSEPDPFSPLPAKSPGMLPDGAIAFHIHAGIVVDDPGHPHDIGRLVEEVLFKVGTAVPDDIRRWLHRDFFAFHLQRYSIGRRKAPLYWPLTTTSAIYTLWVYYPALTSQTLYSAINDFVEPRLRQVGDDTTALRNKGGNRTGDDEKNLEALQGFELELIELRDTLFRLAPTYKPNHDDGVQICAAPLWPLFRHKPWQKVLKDTWVKLEKGDYDWAHMAMNYWPERVHEKCKTDKSLAIAHSLEHLHKEPNDPPIKVPGGVQK